MAGQAHLFTIGKNKKAEIEREWVNYHGGKQSWSRPGKMY